MSGPEITAGTQLSWVPGSLIRDGSLNYDDIAANYADTSSLQARGSLSLVDNDAGSNNQPVFENTTQSGSYGSFQLVDGNWTYTLDPRSTPILDNNDVIQDTITLTASDGVTQTQVNVVIGGSEQALQNPVSGLGSSFASEGLSDVIALDDVTGWGTDGADSMQGTSTADVLLAGQGHDIIQGGLGNDIIDGGLGDDLIIGGQGNDTLAGGAGSDTFAFLRGDQGSANDPAVDHIADFDAQHDALNLSDLLHNEGTDTLESFLSIVDDGEGHAMLNISSDGDGNVDQQVVFDNMSVEDMASAYNVDTSGMTTEQISSSVIDAMVLQSKIIID
ncbi:calcium-binding protein [Enterovibrio coralii]|uniref:Uncharacterized protein n=1 Tax=Enterovibrio coralii TaxID=294935 RepID=A0A135IDQ5_9GAMM|nr:type I secretion C-terminal target domain-containing protein [Enterovibrio coralii]KXF83596.1 hypothetical protein ATN88_24920 [Enterovibrio coralii]